jgi:hypothetical protein
VVDLGSEKPVIGERSYKLQFKRGLGMIKEMIKEMLVESLKRMT